MSQLPSSTIQRSLELKTWQIQAIQNAIQKADSKKFEFIEHEKIVRWLNSWGSDYELAAPE